MLQVKIYARRIFLVVSCLAIWPCPASRQLRLPGLSFRVCASMQGLALQGRM
jgi:hypothetical protein